MLQYQIMAYKTFSGNPISNVSHFKIIIVSAGEHVNINEMKRLEWVRAHTSKEERNIHLYVIIIIMSRVGLKL